MLRRESNSAGASSAGTSRPTDEQIAAGKSPWVLDCSQIDKPNTVLVIVGQPLRSRNGDAGLADTARADKRD